MESSRERYDRYRREYPEFIYHGFSLEKENGLVKIAFDFEIPGLAAFRPTTTIDLSGFELVNDFDSETGKQIVFSLGMVEAVSYLKAAMCPVMRVECGFLDESDALRWKKLYFKGLSELFYRNGLEPDFESFLTIVSTGERKEPSPVSVRSGSCLVPIGGGKDSAVTTELVKSLGVTPTFFTVNDQQARTDTVTAAGFDESLILRTTRTIDPALLELNAKGFFNGHTPFSAIVAFLSYYCAYLTGSENIVLSNESSANESNISGLEVNHQYSKSVEFERDFTEYAKKHFTGKIRYFSILRPFNELQIAKYFSRFDAYLYKFRSCNRGSKKNVWCCGCAKCLFVYIMLSPFIEPEKLSGAIGENMLDKPELTADFDGLTGASEVKPFECVGTAREVRSALRLAERKFYPENRPYLLRRFDETAGGDSADDPLRDFNEDNSVPPEFMPAVKEMLSYVSRQPD